MEFTVSSRPGEKKSEFEVSSRPKGQPAPAGRQPGASLLDHYMRLMGESADAMKQGYGQMTAPGASLGSRAVGAGQAALGGLSYVASPFSAAMRRVIGNPAEVVAGAAGASPETQTKVGDIAGIAGEILGPAGLPKAVQSAPAIARALPGAMPAINRGATTVGQVGRGAINTVEDLIKSGVEGAQRRAATRAADVAPTMSKLKEAKDVAYKDAFSKGGVMGEADYAKFLDDDLKAFETANRVKIKDTLTPQAKALRDNLETYRGRPLSLEDLDDLLQENRDLVSKAASEAASSNTRRDLAAAQALSKRVRDFVYSWEPAGQGAEALESFRKAKELARRTIKMRSIEEIIDVAKRLDDPNEIQRAFRAIAKDKTEYSNFSPAEQKLIDALAQDTKMEKVGDVVPAVGGATRKINALRGANAGGRLDKAQELIDTIARGEADQQARAAQRAAQPSFGQRIEETLRPPVNNTQTRRRRNP